MSNTERLPDNTACGEKKRFDRFLPVIVRIALRNLTAHRSKTIIIGTLITLGIMLLVVGNSMLDTAQAGIRKTFIDNFTGDLIVCAKTQGSISLFGADPSTMLAEGGIPQIPDYDKVVTYVKSMKEAETYTPEISGAAMIVQNEKPVHMMFLFGIDPDTYKKTFPSNIDLVAGRFLNEDEPGIVISQNLVDKIKEEEKTDVKVGDSVLLTGFGMAGLRLKEIPVRGIFKFKNSNEFLDLLSLADSQSLRALFSMSVGTDKDIVLEKGQTDLLADTNEDALFSDSPVISDAKVLNANPLDLLKSSGKDTGKTAQIAPVASAVNGAWHFLVIKLKNGSALPSVMKKLDAYFKAENIPARTIDWQAGAGGIGTLSVAIKIMFNIFIIIIAVVAIFIIMNTLVISITERIAEIGTMRAFGAQKSFVRKLIFTEVICIMLVFGVLGLALGSGVLAILNATGIAAPNMFFEIIMGGKVLHPVLTPLTLVAALFIILVIGIFSSLYPLSIAMRIKPVRAIATE